MCVGERAAKSSTSVGLRCDACERRRIARPHLDRAIRRRITLEVDRRLAATFGPHRARLDRDHSIPSGATSMRSTSESVCSAAFTGSSRRPRRRHHADQAADVRDPAKALLRHRGHHGRATRRPAQIGPVDGIEPLERQLASGPNRLWPRFTSKSIRPARSSTASTAARIESGSSKSRRTAGRPSASARARLDAARRGEAPCPPPRARVRGRGRFREQPVTSDQELGENRSEGIIAPYYSGTALPPGDLGSQFF